MKYLKALGIIALALMVCAPVFAETQTVKVSGELDALWIYRDNLDLRDGNDASTVPQGTAVPAAGGVGNNNNRSDGQQHFMSIAEVEIAADLTDNVSTVLRLYNQRDWNANSFADSGAGTTTNLDTDEFDVAVDLAYVELKEIFYAPLTLTIGRQDLWYGRGFIVGDFQIQDPNGTVQADELGTAFAYDAVKAVLDFEPWTVDTVFAHIQEGAVNSGDDHYFWLFNVNYQFAKYNAVAEAYVMADVDENINANAAGTNNLTTVTVGGRVQYDPVENITLGAELAWQGGDYYSATPGRVKEQRDAFGGELFGEYRWDHEYNPMVGLQYVFFSGIDGTVDGTGDYEAWNSLFRGPTFGDIRDYQEILYATALAADQPAGSNQQHVAIYSTLEPLDDLQIDSYLYFFWNDEAIVSGGASFDEEIGQELDIHVNYDYTEDVAFGLWLAWFFPGDLFNNQSQGGNAGDTDATATQIVSSLSVAF